MNTFFLVVLSCISICSLSKAAASSDADSYLRSKEIARRLKTGELKSKDFRSSPEYEGIRSLVAQQFLAKYREMPIYLIEYTELSCAHAFALYAAENYSEALQAFIDVEHNAEEQVNKSVLDLVIGSVCEKTGHLPDAFARYRKAAESGTVDAMRNLAKLLLDGKDSSVTAEKATHEALFWLEKSLEHDNKNAQVWNCLGIIYKQMKQFDTAIKYLSRAMKLKPRAKYRYDLGLAFYESGNEAAAESTFLEAITIDGNPSAANVIATMALRHKDTSKAEHFARIGLNHENATSFHKIMILNTLGTIYRMRGENEQAKELYEQALQIECDNPECKDIVTQNLRSLHADSD